MAGRTLRRIELSDDDRKELERIVRDGRTEQRVAQRARILLAMSQGQSPVWKLSERVERTPTGIWYVCRRYEERGLGAIYDAPRSGRPRQISPLGGSPNRATGLL